MEILPGFEFLSCCQHSAVEKIPTHHEKDCEHDGCAAIELGHYKLANPQQALLRPLLLFVAWLVPLPDIYRDADSACLVCGAFSPPDLPRIWQFSQRTALPPRAPSVPS